ncbi:bifunctional DNA primase/polymerase [Mycolicibacterium peregrinum]|uniref:bifunctional DNA primase/polymerase n=1 Tax=Mycolicibacterium peregrinum TaxID=43304 RepID=UPI0006D79583|nr:bifunctional DNA primase/polymerase [Mycolicibacterium peregrinum]MCV7204925.1 bifunctional DNA primase/polymerase [Mycolicibacterium peregrinum]ORW59495.1 hypothetical protein AWC21_12330 [Mycolicibacterium peregrinum]
MSENAPIRMVHPDDAPVKVLLQYAGLSPADIPGEGRIVTLAEVEAEVARRGITVSIPDPLPAPTREEADAFVFRMQRLGAHLLRLRPGSKKPVDEAWGDLPALTEAEAIEWLVTGGNLGVNLGRSNAIVLDPENAAATQFLMAAGLKPTVVTAKGEDVTSPKVGGRHVWIAVPEGVGADQLRSVLQIKLGEDGLIDVLAGSRFVVAPGSRLDEAPGYRYGFATGGALVDDGEWRVAPPWLFDATATGPTVELEPLRGILAPRVRRERTPNPQSDAITEAIDQVSWGRLACERSAGDRHRRRQRMRLRSVPLAHLGRGSLGRASRRLPVRIGCARVQRHPDRYVGARAWVSAPVRRLAARRQ